MNWYQMVRDGGTVFDLSDKGLGDDGAREVARALKESNTKVKKLNLGHNNIGAEGAIAIAEALKVNIVLQKLGLLSNNIGEKGAIAIAAASEKNGSLQTLSLGFNNIGDAMRNRIKMLLSADSREKRAAQLLANSLRQQQEEKERQQKEQEEKAAWMSKMT